MDSIDIVHVADKKLISSKEIARLYKIKHAELFEFIEALCKFDPYERALFQKAEGHYLMEEKGFLAILTYASLDKERDNIKTEVCKMLSKNSKGKSKDKIPAQNLPAAEPEQIFTAHGERVKFLTDFQIGGQNYHLYDAGMQNLLVKATDLCAWLNFVKRSWGGYDGSRLAKNLGADEKIKVNIIEVLGNKSRIRKQWLVTLDAVQKIINSDTYRERMDKDIRESLNKMIDDMNSSTVGESPKPIVIPDTKVQVQEKLPDWFACAVVGNNDDMEWLDELPPEKNITPQEKTEGEIEGEADGESAKPMSAELQIVTEQEVLGRNFTVYGTAEEPLFLAKDVAEMIEYDRSSVHKMLNTVEEEEKVRKIVPTPGGVQESWFLTEDGLYEVLMQSRKPIAKQFKKQVKAILKQIRKTGAYMSPQVAADIQQVIVQNSEAMKQFGHLVIQNSQIAAQNTQLMAQLVQMMTERIDKNGELVSRISAAAEQSAQNTNLISKMVNQLGRNITTAIKDANTTPALTVTDNNLPANNSEPDITGCITLKAAAEKHGFYTIKTGKPNYSLVADILKYGCGIMLTVIPGYKDEYIIVKPTVSVRGDIRPCIFLTVKAQIKLNNYIVCHIHKILKVETYKRAYNHKAKGDWRFDYIQFPGRRRHIIANKNGMVKKFAA